MGDDSKPARSARELRRDAGRWSGLLRDFLDGGHRAVSLRMKDYPDWEPEDLATAITYAVDLDELEDELEVVAQEDRVLLVRYPMPSDDEFLGPDGLDYLFLVRVAMRRNLTSTLLDLEPGDDAESVRAQLERVVDALGEWDRITVRVESPRRLSIRIRGGHTLPNRVPAKLGLKRWVEAVEGLVFGELVNEIVSEPVGDAMPVELEGFTAAVAAMGFDDVLVVEPAGDRVRVRRTNGVETPENAPDVTDARRAWDAYVAGEDIDHFGRVSDDTLLHAIARFIESGADTVQFPLHVFADGYWAAEAESKIGEAEPLGGVGRMFAYQLERMVHERGLEEQVRVAYYDTWDVRFERPGASGLGKSRELSSTGLRRGDDGLLHLSRDLQLAAEDFLIGFLRDFREGGNTSETFPLDDFIDRLAGNQSDAYLEQGRERAGGQDWVALRVLRDLVVERDKEDRLLVRYYGPDDVRLEVVDGAEERRWVAGALDQLLHDHEVDGVDMIETTLKDDVLTLPGTQAMIWREAEERGIEDRLSMEVLDERRLRTVLDAPRGRTGIAIGLGDVGDTEAEERILAGFIAGKATELRLYFADDPDEEEDEREESLLRRMGALVVAAANRGELDELHIGANKADGYVRITRRGMTERDTGGAST